MQLLRELTTDRSEVKTARSITAKDFILASEQAERAYLKNYSRQNYSRQERGVLSRATSPSDIDHRSVLNYHSIQKYQATEDRAVLFRAAASGKTTDREDRYVHDITNRTRILSIHLNNANFQDLKPAVINIQQQPPDSSGACFYKVMTNQSRISIKDNANTITCKNFHQTPPNPGGLVSAYQGGVVAISSH